MTTVARRQDRLALNAEDDLARSSAIVPAVGYQLVPLRHAIGPWGLLGVCSEGLLLVSVVRDAWPSTMGAVWGHPASFPVNTRRLTHKWEAGTALPEALSLS